MSSTACKRCDGSTSKLHLVKPLPLPTPLATRLAVPPVPGAPPRVLPLLAMPEAALPLVDPPRPGTVVCLDLVADGGMEYLLAVLLLAGGFSTNEVSVVMNVASVSAAVRSRKGES